MEIFGKHIFGSDAEQWLKLCKEQKKEWVFKYTNQTDETLIDEFIKNPKITKECKCLDCGKNGNISKTISDEVATVVKVEQTSGNGGGGIAKRRKHNKAT